MCEEKSRNDVFTALVIKYLQLAKENPLNSSRGGGATSGSILVFTETKDEARALAALDFGQRVKIAALTGDLSQSQRERTLADFRSGKLDVITATDVAARGLDIDGISTVIQYRFPREFASFVHRTGRCGRAGKQGTCALLVKQNEISSLLQLEKQISTTFSMQAIPSGNALMSNSLHPSQHTSLLSKLVSLDDGITKSVVSSGLYQRVVSQFTSLEESLQASLALLLVGNTNSLASYSLLNGQKGVSTISINVSMQDEIENILGDSFRYEKFTEREFAKSQN
jgi:superfamily II DNA/RNA helicase